MNILFSGNAWRKLGTVLAGGAALMLMSNFAMAAAGDIALSKHNLSSNTTAGTANSFTGTGEICVFCHTPHGANAGVTAPLWNRAESSSTPAVYTRYSSMLTPSFDATETAIGSVSIACLSCHDGTQAMNSIINTPGSGTDPNTFLTSGGWSSPSTLSTSVGGFLGNETTLQAPMLGAGGLTVDLSNDHPISMQYAGGKASAGNYAAGTDYVSADFNDTDFADIKARTGKAVWYVEANATAGFQKDDLPLYTRNDTTLGSAQPLVECASCHDPHNITNGTFLRKSNSTTASGLCLTCHLK